jgi:hypothetical protein
LVPNKKVRCIASICVYLCMILSPGRCKATAIFLWQPQGGFQFFFATAITDLCTELPFC